MTSRRCQKAAAAIREVVSMAILADLKDPRVQNVTVTFVEVAPDMRQAKVHVSIMGDENQQRLTLHGLESARGFLQKKIGNRIETRYTPRLEFVLDMGVKRSIEIARVLQEILPGEPVSQEPGIDSPGQEASFGNQAFMEDDDEQEAGNEGGSREK